MNGSSPSLCAGASSATRMGVVRQPVATSAWRVTLGLQPRASASRTAAPSAWETVQTTVVGSSATVRSDGLPQTGERHISWICSCGLMCSCPAAPAREAFSATAGVAIPSTTAMQPRTSCRAKSAADPAATSTSRPVVPPGVEDCDMEWVMAVSTRPSTSTRAGPGRLM